jgi:hypothetical protein
MLLIGVPSAVAADGTAPESLYQLEDGVLVIGWSPGVGFSLNSTELGGDSNTTVEENGGQSILLEESVSSDLNSTAASLNMVESGAGDAHLGWASWDPQSEDHGRHTEYGRRVTDLVGVFSIEMQIKLGSNLSSSPGTTEWIPCP